MRRIRPIAVSVWVLTVGVLIVGLAACGRGGARAAQSGAWPADRTFRSTSVSEAGRDRPLVAGTRVELRLGPDGQLGASAGCNQLGGVGRIDDGLLVIDGALAQTEMGCDADRMAQDTWLAAFLTARPTWRLDGDELVLTSERASITLVDRKVIEPDLPLAGTRWVVDTIITGDTASSLPPGGEATLHLDGKSGFSAATGCTTIRGTAMIHGDTIRFVVSGTPACPPSAGLPPPGGRDELHAAVIATLRGDVGFVIDGPSLTLTATDGTGLRLRG